MEDCPMIIDGYCTLGVDREYDLEAAGLVAALFAAWGAFFAMFFTIFTERLPRGVGWVVLAAFVGSIVDAVLRVVWSAMEWRASRIQT